MSMLAGILFLISGCKKLDKFTQFEMDYTTQATIPASTGINLPFNVLTPDVKTNAENEFEANDTRKDLIESIKLTELELTITDPANEDFSFLKEAEIFISAEGLEKQSVAHFDNISDQAGNTLSATPKDVDLAPYVKKDEFKLQLEATTDEFLSRDHTIEIYRVFFLDAEVLGQ